MNPLLGRAMTPEEYANEWHASATRMAANGHYAWMVQQLGAATTVLEIGCGSGASTLSLVRAGMVVLSLDVNEFLISKSLANFIEKGVAADRVTADELSKVDLDSGPKIRLLQGNVFDSAIAAALPTRRFDAIICWLTGANPEVISGRLAKDHNTFDGSELALYRKQVHSRCYELGQSVLKPDGIVHIVDRMAISSWNDKDYLRAHLADLQGGLAGPRYILTRDQCLLRRMEEENLRASRIQYVSDAPPGGLPVLGSSRTALCG